MNVHLLRPSSPVDHNSLFRSEWETTMTDEEIKRLAAEMIAGTLRALIKQAEVNELAYLATLLGRALEEAQEQAREES
jgi:hypothetical protein